MTGKEVLTKIQDFWKRLRKEKDESEEPVLNHPLQEDEILIKTEEVKSFELAKIKFYAVFVIIGLFLLFVPVFKPFMMENPPSFEKTVEEFVDPLASFFLGKSTQESTKNYDSFLSDEDAKKAEYLFEIQEKETYSYWDEIVYVSGQLFLKQSPVNLYDIFTSALGFFWLVIVLCVVLIVQGIRGIVKSVRNINCIEKTRMEYAMRIEKNRKQDLIKLHKVYHVWLLAACVLIDRWIPFGGKLSVRRLGVDRFFNFSNCLLTFWIALVLFIVLFVVKFNTEVLDLRVKDEVSKRWKQRKNKQDNERARQKKQKEQRAEQSKQMDFSSEGKNIVGITNEQSKNEVALASNEAAEGVDELLKYKSLLNEGIITPEEFDAKKKQLLGL